MCVSAIRIKHPYIEGKFLDVPCGKCIECCKKKRFQWCFRMEQEFNNSNRGCFFVTLTYDNEFLPHKPGVIWFDQETGECKLGNIPCFVKSHVINFIRSIRDKLRYQSKIVGIHKDVVKFSLTNFKYFACSEYGSKSLRPHYHLLFFDVPFNLEEFTFLCNDLWHFGFVSVSIMNSARIQYTTKYILKQDLFRPKGLSIDADRNFILCSKNLGLCYLTDERIKDLKEKFDAKVIFHDHLVILPRYYRDKVFTDIFSKIEIRSKLMREYDRFKSCPDSELNPFEWYDKKVNREYQKYLIKIGDEIL